MTKVNGKPTLIGYYRDELGRPVGAVVAVLDESKKTVNFGWSIVAKNKKGELLDTPEKSKAVMIASGRAEKIGLQRLPRVLVEFTEDFIQRTKKYFKQEGLTYEDSITISDGIGAGVVQPSVTRR